MAGSFCFTYSIAILILYYTGKNSFFLFAFFLFATLSFSKFSLNRIYLLTGAALGFLRAFYVFNLYYIPVEAGRTYEAVVIETSQKSFVAEGKTPHGRFRIRLKSHEKPYKGERLTFSCFRFYAQPGAFQTLERLQSVFGYCTKSKIIWPAEAPSVWKSDRRRIRQYIQARLSELPSYSFAPGFLLADTSSLHPRELLLFRKMGTAHLFSASGLHLGLIFGFFVFVFRLFRIPGKPAGLIFCFVYTILLDFRLSLMRAFIFLVLYLFSRLLDRKTNSISLLFLTAMILEWLYPLFLFSPSFLLSFCVTLSILYFYPRLHKIITVKNPYLRSHLSVTTSALPASGLLSLWLFSYFHIFSFFYNLFLTPFAAVYLIFVLLYLFFPASSVLVEAGDKFYHGFAAFHLYFWHSHYPSLSEYRVWALVLLALSVFVFYHFAKGSLWQVYRTRRGIFILFFVSFFCFVNWSQYPKRMVFPFATGVLFYNNKTLSVAGRPASFSTAKIRTALQYFDNPLERVFFEKPFEETVQSTVLLPGQKINVLKTKYRAGILRLDENCFVFLSQLEPLQWDKNTLPCKNLYLVQSKKDKISHKQWKSFFQSYGDFDTIQFLSYFQWYRE